MNTHEIKEFFSQDEWDLIHSLVHENKQLCDNEESNQTYVSIENKIYKLFENK